MNNIQEQQKVIEQKLIGLRLTIEFKEYLLSKDVHSRGIILEYCKEWILLESKKEPSQYINQCYIWFQNMFTINQEFDNETRKNQFKSHITWEDLHRNLSQSLSLQKLINLFLNEEIPSENIQ